MGKTILTPTQHHFLELAGSEKEITRWYYLTGGTALSEFYLHHRLSEDIDLFTASDVNDQKTDALVHRFLKESKAISFDKRNIAGLYTYSIKFRDKSILKIDFNGFPFEPVETSKIKFHTIRIDSFYDIGINKVYTILGRVQPRDLIDLYFILQKNEFSLEQLIARTEDKYSTTFDRLFFSSQLCKVLDSQKPYPKMLVPFDFEEMKQFFIKTAKQMGEKHIFKK